MNDCELAPLKICVTCGNKFRTFATLDKCRNCIEGKAPVTQIDKLDPPRITDPPKPKREWKRTIQTQVHSRWWNTQQQINAIQSGEPKSDKHECTSIRGSYVYAWLDDGAVFYIGKGEHGRMFANHGDASCQTWREKIGTRWSCVVIRDNLTEEGAQLIESVLIDLINPACNIALGIERRDKPPLTISRELYVKSRKMKIRRNVIPQ